MSLQTTYCCAERSGGQLNDEPPNVSALHPLTEKVHIEQVGSTEKDLGRREAR